MKKTLLITGVILLAGCTTERVVYVQPTDAPQTPTTKVIDSASANERDFINYLAETFGMTTDLNEMAVETGYQVCALADDGASAQDFVDILEATGAEEPEFLAGVIAAALNFLCPGHRFLLNDLDTAI